jgi:hypothetical protein
VPTPSSAETGSIMHECVSGGVGFIGHGLPLD